jgi:hypothetical protein
MCVQVFVDIYSPIWSTHKNKYREQKSSYNFLESQSFFSCVSKKNFNQNYRYIDQISMYLLENFENFSIFKEFKFLGSVEPGSKYTHSVSHGLISLGPIKLPPSYCTIGPTSSLYVCFLYEMQIFLIPINCQPSFAWRLIFLHLTCESTWLVMEDWPSMYLFRMAHERLNLHTPKSLYCIPFCVQVCQLHFM